MEGREEVHQEGGAVSEDAKPQAPGGPGGPGIEGETSGGSGGAAGEPAPGERSTGRFSGQGDASMGPEEASTDPTEEQTGGDYGGGDDGERRIVDGGDLAVTEMPEEEAGPPNPPDQIRR